MVKGSGVAESPIGWGDDFMTSSSLVFRVFVTSTFADLSDDASLAEQLLKYTLATLLKERHEDLAFFDERVEKGLVAKLEGIVASEFVRMDYGEAIAVL